VAGNEGVDGDVSGEEAAWRDLVARFDLPVETESEQAPWPARENLTESARDRQRPDQDAESGWDDPGAAGRASPGGRPGPASLPSRPGAGLWPADEPGTDDTRPDQGPAAPADGTGPAGPRLNASGIDSAHPDTSSTDITSPDGTAPEGANGANGANGSGQAPARRPRIIRRAGPGRPDQVAQDDDEDEDNRYVPPPPEPLPPLDPVAKGAWAGVLGGPGYLLIARLADWQIPDWAALLAIVAFVAGFATLVVRMGDRPRDDDDDGAVV
jgi:hypothetical protein